MKPASPVSKCPHCGGVSGFITRVVFNARRLHDWSGGDIDTDNYTVASETSPSCADCGRAVRSLFNARAATTKGGVA